MSDAPLTCHALHKTFRLGHSNLEILHGLDAAFPGTGLNTIQGASGSGKSTLLQILGGLEAPDSGEVRWKGESIYGWSRGKLAAWRNLSVGFVFQAYHLFPELSALENVEFPARLARHGDSAASAHLLEQVGLGSRLHHRPAELSGGEQQRVAIARALRNNPALLLADEPTGNLDSKNSDIVLNLLKDLNKRLGQTILMITHNPEAAAYADRTIHMRDGQVLETA